MQTCFTSAIYPFVIIKQMHKIKLTVLLSFLFIICISAKNNKSDKKIVKKYYKACNNKNYKKLKALTNDHFELT